MEKILNSKLKKLEVSNITKYFKNQVPPTDMTSSFTDNYFPPNENSIRALDKDGKLIDQINSETIQKKN